jgi:hypothetical protein
MPAIRLERRRGPAAPARGPAFSLAGQAVAPVPKDSMRMRRLTIASMTTRKVHRQRTIEGSVLPWPIGLIGGGLRPWFGVGPEGYALAMSKAREARAAATRSRRAWLPPRWLVLLFWHGHRALVCVTRGRLGLWRPKPDGWGALRLTTTGRCTGRPRQVVVGYFEDGRNLITMAMNGWGAAIIRSTWSSTATAR